MVRFTVYTVVVREVCVAASGATFFVRGSGCALFVCGEGRAAVEVYPAGVVNVAEGRMIKNKLETISGGINMDKIKMIKVITALIGVGGAVLFFFGFPLIFSIALFILSGVIRWVGLAKAGAEKSELNKIWKSFAVLGVIFLVLIVVGYIIKGGPRSTSGSDRTCKVCGEVYSDSDNTKKIARTGMCISCYNEYEWSQNAKKAAETYH